MPDVAKKGPFKGNGFFLCTVAAMVLLICATRLPGLMHGAEFHPDEYVFYATTRAALDGDWSFQAIKPYPNGAYVYQLFIFLLAEVYNRFIGWLFWLTPIVIGRLASVFYFCAGSVLGAYLCWKMSGRQKPALCVYALIMAFSLFHLEQSRYGTGDAITFFVLMLVLCLLERFWQNGRAIPLYMAAFFVGTLCAVKFPLALALGLPVACLVLSPQAAFRQKPGAKKMGALLLLFACFAVGLLFFTPAFFSDPAFFAKVLQAETGGYLGAINEHGAGNALNHLGGILLYQLLYADIPLATVFAVLGWRRLAQRPKENKNALFVWMLPAFALVFLLVNLFASTFFLRAMYPFLFICNLYAAVEVGALLQSRRKVAAGVALTVAAFTVLRGSLFAVDLAGPGESEKTVMLLQQH